MVTTEDFILKNTRENPFRNTKELAEMNGISIKRCRSILNSNNISFIRNYCNT